VTEGERRRLFRIVAWLLTPVAAWAASFLGGWLGAQVGARFGSPVGGIGFLVGGAVLGGLAGVVAWIGLLRRLRQDDDSAS
jgi:outer membrane lipoprotein SlyB